MTPSTIPFPRLIGLLLGGLSVLAVLAASASAADNEPRAGGADDEPRAVRTFELTAAPVRWEIQPGLVVDGWGFNGQVPGPQLRVKEGELVKVRLRNLLPVPTTIHWHGIDVPLHMDGVPGLSQPVVAPEEDFTYEFVATNPGTRWYHTHVDENLQQELGLYGAFIVEPRDPEPVAYDAEYTYLLDERALDLTPDVALGRAQPRNRDVGNGRGGLFAYDLFLLNGRAGDAIPPMHTAPGQRIRVRLVNAGNLPHAMHLHGQSFRIIATDGNPVPPLAQLVKDTVLIGPGERYDLEVDATNPGVWMFHCHMPNHMENGMMTTLVFQGFEAPSHQTHGPQPEPAPSKPAPTSPPPASGSTAAVTMLGDRFDQSSLTVPVGTTVRWTNTSVNVHTVTSFDGTFDGGAVPPGESTSIKFDRPGTYRYYCRQHILGGMLGTVIVQ
jgi:FtsP/CotA-like multicopper oxidase with cupredoxin domain